MVGEESEVADIDWIRKNLGFVADPHRICVGITRSKFGLVIVGECRVPHIYQWLRFSVLSLAVFLQCTLCCI